MDDGTRMAICEAVRDNARLIVRRGRGYGIYVGTCAQALDQTAADMPCPTDRYHMS